MYYVKLFVYYALTVSRTLLLVLFIPVKWLGVTLVDTLSEWELIKPKRIDDIDDSDMLDYLNAEDPYYSKHHAKKQHIKEQMHTVNTLMRYTYNIYSGTGVLVEENLNSEEEARTVIAHLLEAGVNTSDFTVKREQHYTTTGLGRDPDLHQRDSIYRHNSDSGTTLIRSVYEQQALRLLCITGQKTQLYGPNNSIV